MVGEKPPVTMLTGMYNLLKAFFLKRGLFHRSIYSFNHLFHTHDSDQARAMELAIIDELPNTKKAKESLGVLYGKKSEFKKDFQMLVHHVLTKEEFENRWAEMLAKYGLQKHPFPTQIFEVRHKWAKPYFMCVFCAKMTSTQRSESANHMLKTYVPASCPMHLFVRQYMRLLFDRQANEKSGLLCGRLSSRMSFTFEGISFLMI